jgi:ABC-type phosphate/phosphonate transport system ATPase subunit
MKRNSDLMVIIVGLQGAGKTTLARQLKGICDAPIYTSNNYELIRERLPYKKTDTFTGVVVMGMELER